MVFFFSVALRKDDAPLGRFPGEDAGARTSAQSGIVRDAADRHFHLLLQSLFLLDAAGPVDEGESAVGLGLVGVGRREEFPELVHRGDLDGVFVAEGEGRLEESVLNRLKNPDDSGDRLGRGEELFVLRRLITPRESDGSILEITGPDLDANGDAFLIHSQFLTPPPRSRLSISTVTGRPWKDCPFSSAASF